MENLLINEDDFFKDFNKHSHLPISLESHFQPWFDDRADFNTNARSYYEYLAHLNFLTREMVMKINRLLRRDLSVTDSKTVDLTKDGDWLGIDKPFTDIINIKADVILSKLTQEYILGTKDNKFISSLENSLKILDDGLYSPNFEEALSKLFDDLKTLEDFVKAEIEKINKLIEDLQNSLREMIEKNNQQDQKIKELEDLINQLRGSIPSDNSGEITTIKSALQKIIDNLATSGAITSNTLNDFSFNSGRNIATGNINIFGGSTDGNSFIKTSNDMTENDLAGGV